VKSGFIYFSKPFRRLPIRTEESSLCLHTVDIYKGFNHFTISPDKKYYALLSDENTFKVYNASHEIVAEQTLEGNIVSINFFTDANWLLVK